MVEKIRYLFKGSSDGWMSFSEQLLAALCDFSDFIQFGAHAHSCKHGATA
jgi:hypothetical protein